MVKAIDVESIDCGFNSHRRPNRSKPVRALPIRFLPDLLDTLRARPYTLCMKAAINRKAEHQTLRGGHPRLVRDGWSPPAEELPLLDEESVRFPSSKRHKRKRETKRERCPGNLNGHTHEWLKDTVEVPLYLRYWEWYSDRHEELIGTHEITYRLCAHCDRIQWRQNGHWIPTASELHRKYGRVEFPTAAYCYRRDRGRVYLGNHFSVF